MAFPDPRDLFDLDVDRPDLSGAVLLETLDGFIDAGSAVRLLRTHLLTGPAATPAQVVARFDVDQLFDYRARRPLMQFDADHWSEYDEPELVLRLLHDEDGVPYLVLTGPEPDILWERFIAAVGLLVEELGIRLVVGLDAFPMSVPHTRPTPVILHGSRRELFSDFTPWLGRIGVPASAGHLLEYRLGRLGHDTLGIGAPVPPYIAQGEFPAAALALLHEVSARTGLRLPVGALEEAAIANRAAIDREAAASEEIQTLIAALEEQYDTQLAPSDRSALGDGSLPTADELGAELERFLADRARGDRPGDRPTGSG